jgi:hypothetical protein
MPGLVMPHLIMKSVRQRSSWRLEEYRPYDARLAICAYCSHIIDRDEQFVPVRRGFAHTDCQPPKTAATQDSPQRQAQRKAALELKDELAAGVSFNRLQELKREIILPEED